MEKFSISKSTREGVMQPHSMYNLRSCSASTYYPPPPPPTHLNQNVDYNFKQVKIKKSRISSSSSSSSSKNWNFRMDPELQRKKRVAGYKAYTVEGKLKGSFRKSFRWIKDTCNHVVHGFW